MASTSGSQEEMIKLQTKMIKLQKEIEDLEDDVRGVKAKVAIARPKKKEKLEKRLITLEKRLTALEERLTTLQQREVLLLRQSAEASNAAAARSGTLWLTQLVKSLIAQQGILPTTPSSASKRAKTVSSGCSQQQQVVDFSSTGASMVPVLAAAKDALRKAADKKWPVTAEAAAAIAQAEDISPEKEAQKQRVADFHFYVSSASVVMDVGAGVADKKGKNRNTIDGQGTAAAAAPAEAAALKAEGQAAEVGKKAKRQKAAAEAHAHGGVEAAVDRPGAELDGFAEVVRSGVADNAAVPAETLATGRGKGDKQRKRKFGVDDTGARQHAASGQGLDGDDAAAVVHQGVCAPNSAQAGSPFGARAGQLVVKERLDKGDIEASKMMLRDSHHFRSSKERGTFKSGSINPSAPTASLKFKYDDE